MTFYWLTHFADSFVNSDWLELVVYFQTNEQSGEQNAFLLFRQQRSTTRFSRQVCATFEIGTF